jgi:hypothetical protein
MPKNLSTDTGSIESGHIEPIKVWISAACGKTGRTQHAESLMVGLAKNVS